VLFRSLTQLPLEAGSFDVVVSAHAMDHLGDRAPAALAETCRVLRPGGRFLLVVWVPGWVTFSLANVLCLLLPTPARWRTMAAGAGLRLREEGWFNGLWFGVWERPG
jgi:SAM-dependent methyltransferase